jgi:hypothetical protein
MMQKMPHRPAGRTEKGHKDCGFLCNRNRPYTLPGICGDKNGEGFSHFSVKLDSSDKQSPGFRTMSVSDMQ